MSTDLPDADASLPPPAPPAGGEDQPMLDASILREDPLANSGPTNSQARDIVRLFQCRVCSAPYEHIISLPCGGSICKTCMPVPFIRTGVSFPDSEHRREGFICPYEDCKKVHAVVDCSNDVILNKVAEIVHAEMERGNDDAARLELSVRIKLYDWSEDEPPSPIGGSLMGGSRLMATWALAAQRRLPYEADVLVYDEGQQNDECDDSVIGVLQKTLRAEMDCQICYSLLYDPLTAECGHTFCRSCLLRVFVINRRCPMCRRDLCIDPHLQPYVCPPNDRILEITETFWEDELMARGQAMVAEAGASDDYVLIPLFICGLVFPTMPLVLNVFEEHYRVMIRRVIEGDMTFGVVMPRSPDHQGDADFYQFGTLMQIVDYQHLPDGRSLVESKGLSRFRVVTFSRVDGYSVGKALRIDDVGLQQEEALELAEVGYDVSDSAAGRRNDAEMTDLTSTTSETSFWSSLCQFGSELPQSTHDLHTMTTQSLARFVLGFVDRTKEKDLPWLTDRVIGTYGSCPTDPAAVPWWLGSTMPVPIEQRYELLNTHTVRDRLKICGWWILNVRDWSKR